MDYYTVNQIAKVLDAPSVHSTTLDVVHNFQNAKKRNPGFVPQKKDVASSLSLMEAKRHNLAVEAFLALESGERQ